MRVVVVGGGHNGLVAACYLAGAGAETLVLEQSDKLGGGSRTDELIPGHRFNTHAAAHNIINATDIPAELRLPEAGLRYREMDPFSVAVFGDGTIVRFHRDIERTVDSIAEVDPAEAVRYRAWMRDALPVVAAMRSGLDAGAGRSRRLRRLPGQLVAGARAVARNGGPLGLARLLASPYGRVLAERLGSDLVRAPVSAFAAHASASPDTPGSALFGLWQAFYHQVGQWHPVGGSRGLVDALVRRLECRGGRWRTGAAVRRILRRTSPVDRVTGVELDTGEHLDADAVLTALDPRTALLTLLDPPLSGATADALRGAHQGNAVQLLVLLATTALPGYPGARAGDWNGLQSYVDDVASLPAARRPGRSPRPCPGPHPGARGPAHRLPGLPDGAVPAARAHPMHLDLGLDQLGFLRPTRALGGHTTGVRGLVISGAGTAPVGGIAGVPGRAAARALLRESRRR